MPVDDALQRSLGPAYAVERELHGGGMARVFVAEERRFGRKVVIKLLAAERTGDLSVERFEREIEFAATLQQANIVPVISAGDADGLPWYSMPYVEGESLRARLSEGRVPIAHAVSILRDVLRALAYAHERGIVHRDIKPENVLLSGAAAVVTDFGIAKALTAARTTSTSTTFTAAGASLGTPAYMAPEQALADTVDPRADLYAWGVMAYELLAGAHPFAGRKTAQQLVAAHIAELPTPLISVAPISESVAALIMRCLEKDPANRPTTALEVLEALDSVDASAGPLSRRHVTRPRTTRRRAATVGVSLSIVLLLAAVVATRLHSRASRIATNADLNHIAVLYFDDRSEGAKLRFLADGFTESLIDELSAVRGLSVISRSGVAPLKRRDVSPDSVRRLFNVGSIVTGKLEPRGDSLRVEVALVDAATGVQEDQRTLERSRSDVLRLQDDIVKEVAQFLRRSLGREVQATAVRGTANHIAWEDYQRARQLLAGVDSLVALKDVAGAMRQLDVADTALTFVQAMDRRWAAPLVARAWIPHRKVLLVGFGQPKHIPEWLGHAQSLADSAIRVAPADADALEAQGTMRLFRRLYGLSPTDSDKAIVAAAEADFREAVRINPLQASAWNALAFLLNNNGNRSAEAKLAAQNAYASDPYLSDVDRTIWRLFQISANLHDITEAKRWCELGNQRFPSDFRFAECRLTVTAMPKATGGVDSVWGAYHEFLRRLPSGRRALDSLRAGMIVARALAHRGLADSARHIAVRSRGNSEIDPAAELLIYESELDEALGDTAQAKRLVARHDAALRKATPAARKP